MLLRRAPMFALGLLAVPVLAMGCGGSHSLFGTTVGGGGATSGSGGGATTSGSGGRATGTSSSSSGATTSSSSSSTSTTSGSTTYPAPFPAPPQVITGGGPVHSSPQIYPVFFAGDDSTTVASLADFSKNVGGTPYWTAATSEYGVGPATGHPAIMLGQAAPATIDDATIQTWLATEFAGTDGFPTPDANTLIVLYYPSTTTVTLQGATSCQTFGGYHNSAQVGSQQIAYAVVPRCTGITTTGAASHELIEASTDPQPMVSPAYVCRSTTADPPCGAAPRRRRGRRHVRPVPQRVHDVPAPSTTRCSAPGRTRPSPPATTPVSPSSPARCTSTPPPC